MTWAGAQVDVDRLGARMQRLLERLGSRRRVQHAILGAVTLDGSWDWSGATGEASPDGTPMRTDTPWHLASVTKLYIATVVLRLHESGLLDLDAPIATLLPDELATGLHVLDGVDHTAELTVRHLLGHRSGLPDSLDERPVGGRSLVEQVVADGDRAWSLEEAVALARDELTPHFPPSDVGSAKPRLRYSDTNYQLLMLIAQRVTGDTMAAAFRELLFEPLGLLRTWVPGDEPLAPVLEPATIWLGDQPFVQRPLALRSFGDLYSTLDDTLRFGRALFGAELFDEPTTGTLMQERFDRFGFPRGMAALRAPSWPIEYGLGMMRFELSRAMNGGRHIPGVVGHTGSTGSWLWYCPELELVLAGTVDQASAASVPFRSVPRALAGLSRS